MSTTESLYVCAYVAGVMVWSKKFARKRGDADSRPRHALCGHWQTGPGHAEPVRADNATDMVGPLCRVPQPAADCGEVRVAQPDPGVDAVE